MLTASVENILVTNIGTTMETGVVYQRSTYTEKNSTWS